MHSLISALGRHLLALALLIPVAANGGGSEDIPFSERSREAGLRQAPELRRALAAQGLEFGAPVFIRIFKQSRELQLFVGGPDGFELFRSYPVCRVSGHPGPKRRRGDFQAPEGFYAVRPEGLNPNSDFHLSFDIGYPNARDHLAGRTGSNIMVHGGCVSRGCFAMTDGYMEQIYALVEAALQGGQGQVPVHVFPFPLTRENLHDRRFSRFAGFWAELAPGYRYFDRHRRPPVVEARGDGYRIAGQAAAVGTAAAAQPGTR